MSQLINYRYLFEVNVLHNYFLNKGSTKFVGMNSDDQLVRMKKYDINKCLSILPSISTSGLLKGHRLLFKGGSSGFIVGIEMNPTNPTKPHIPPDGNLSLTFLVKIRDFSFHNYSELKLNTMGQLFYFSNRRLDSEVTSFPIIDMQGDHKIVDDTYCLSTSARFSELKQLDYNEQTDLLGIIRIYMHADDSGWSVTNSSNDIASPSKRFELMIDNRSTVWRYKFRDIPDISPGDDVMIEDTDPKVLITKSKYPLTSTGFISVKYKGDDLPNPDAGLIKTSNNKIFSEIHM